MAKIDTLNFVIRGKEYSSNINVGKSGQFSIHLDREVAKTIGVASKIFSDTKDGVSGLVMGAYNDYCESKIQRSLYISIIYKACGEFSYYKDGTAMFGQDGGYYADGFHEDASELHFGYEVYCKEVRSTGKEVWYSTLLMEDYYEPSEHDIMVEGYKIYNTANNVGGKIIPYSKKAVETLKKAEDGIRGISEVLFKFLGKDTKEIVSLLNSNNLLNLKND